MKQELNDHDCPEYIRSFVRTNADIDVHQYIDRGYNGEVYFGVRKKLGDEVVLKFYIASEGYDSSEEAVILRDINHENILKIYDLRFVPPHSSFFLSPRISGGDLQAYIDGNTIPSKVALELITGILKGITELHSMHKLVHRDLKPGNILLDTATNTPIIADLGSVKKMSEANNYTTTSKATTLYLPPESIVDEEYYFQSDLYQIGLILFQLLGGHFPVDNPMNFLTDREKKKLSQLTGSKNTKTFDDMINTKIYNGKIANLNTLPTHLPPQFKRVLKKAIHKDYTKRFQNPSELLAEIHKLMREFPNYASYQDHLLIDHQNGTEFKICEESQDYVSVAKRKKGGAWRKQHQHNGTLKSALELAHNKN